MPPGLWNYDANDRMTVQGVADPAYDANGNTTAQAGVTNVYDFENHLIQHDAVTVVYDGDGNRVSETASGVTTKYLVDTQNPTGYAQVMEELQSGAVTRRYTWGHWVLSQTQPVSSAWQTSYYGYDGHGSVRFLRDTNGVVTDSYDYDAFGNLLHSTGTTPNNYLFAGEQFDAALGLYYNRARYLDVRTGRFWGMDDDEGQTDDPISLHRYLYSAANSANNIDPSGNGFLADTLFTVGIAVTIFDAVKFYNAPNVVNGAWLALDVVLLPEAVIKAVTTAVGAGSALVRVLNGIRAGTEAARDLNEARAFWSARGFVNVARGETFLAALSRTGAATDLVIENPATRNVFLEEVKTTLREKTIEGSIAKFKNMIAVIKSTGHSVEQLYISASRTRYLGQFVERGGYLFYKDGSQVLVEGIPVVIRYVGAGI